MEKREKYELKYRNRWRLKMIIIATTWLVGILWSVGRFSGGSKEWIILIVVIPWVVLLVWGVVKDIKMCLLDPEGCNCNCDFDML